MNINFMKMISEAAFANPFSDERVEIDRQILGAADHASWEEMLEPLLSAVEKELTEFEQAGELKVDQLSEEGQALGIAVLFHVFHRYMLQFDELIELQMKVDDEIL